ncbi:hypothetical protein NQ166_12090 [Microbacterium sp. zg.Y1090]|uniref:hypothetical protein n=1 Tax=Microbacterium TaxID=33882 RepID=UPI00214B9AA1|nr:MULTISPECIES: hypothetical protein [unclassified Microbacterium]MCR2813251.1 hypothetical protein [Microbacterium sp. zg.Y1084]MCR2819564.1 hypothetical protein [Microbacterium sp. zg.Y1090]MDL5487418.1 hypothetical protein [Microbacterium sp. zg-Y1211]WIM28531.1 hypothetical protein QNO26_01160 [Microbacterium sp. zg-Y1090]
MRGKVGLIIGMAAGYVLGTRAGRERYDQIKQQAMKIWDTEPVQKQVDKAKELGKSAVMALPTAVWDSAVKVTKAATSRGGSAGQRLDAAVAAGKESVDEVAAGAETTAAEVKKAAHDAIDDIKKAADD